MNRRTVIKNLALVLGSAALLPSCLHNKPVTAVALKHIPLDADQQALIADMCETIIPKTTTPGAKDLNLHLFTLKMLDDCYNKKDQQAIVTGLADFNDLVKKKYNQSFSELSVKDREAVLNGIEASAKDQSKNAKPQGRNAKPQKNIDASPINTFYWAVKQQTLFGYTTSQYFMTKQIVYELIPGRYNAHYPVSKLKTA
ncbi:gluconate 2-dehydrogenase subunit 3 family protein [Mucilaginibacter sp.]|uniref:gluconate 2-dehydrogenase subunit 3 family protein n=1 Tax=Mucilaginibacter sp. TaxID=1882438 RepID=UPI003D0C5A4C